jgi:hypothetical protein
VTSEIKTRILETAEVGLPNDIRRFYVVTSFGQLFIKLYPEQLQKSRAVEAFVQGVWALVGSGGLSRVADDAVRLGLLLV